MTLLKGYLSILRLIHTLSEVNKCGFEALLDQVCRSLSSKPIVIITICGSEEELRNCHHHHWFCLKRCFYGFKLRLLLCVKEPLLICELGRFRQEKLLLLLHLLITRLVAFRVV